MRTREQLCNVADVSDGRRRFMPDGSFVNLDGDLDFSRPGTSLVEIGGVGRNQQFACGTISFGEWSATEVGVTEFTEEYTFQEGSLRIGSAVIKDSPESKGVLAHMGVWEGYQYSVKTQVLGGDTSSVLYLFGLLNIVEGALGVRLEPRNGASILRMGSYVPRLLKVIPDIAVVTVRERAPDASLPDWSGSEVSGGELFVKRERPALSLLLVGESTLTSIVPFSYTSEKELISAGSTLLATWIAAT